METKSLLLWLFLCPYLVPTTQTVTNVTNAPYITESTGNVHANTSDCLCWSINQLEELVSRLCQKGGQGGDVGGIGQRGGQGGDVGGKGQGGQGGGKGQGGQGGQVGGIGQGGQGGQGGTEKKQPWEIPDEDIKDLLFDAEGCIKCAVCDLDKCFKKKAWRRMPTDIKKILIALYCKIGSKEIQAMSKVKEKLENGWWKGAARELEKTDFYKRDPDSGDDFIAKLRAVKAKIAKE